MSNILICTMIYNENFNERSYQITRPNFSSHNFFEMEASKQNNYLKNKNNPVCAPSIFLKKSVIERANGFDERFTLMEDFPLWLNITRLGIKIHFLELATVNYRLHSKSIIKSEKVNISAKFAKSYLYFLKNYFLPKDRNFKIKKDIFKFRVYIFLEKLGLNNNYILSKVL